MATIKLGELLIKAGVLNEAQLKSALAEQKKWKGRLGDILVRMEMISEDTLVRALSRQLGYPIVNLDAIDRIPKPVRDKIPAKVARDVNAVPVAIKEDTKALIVAMSEPQNLGHLDQLRAVCRGMKLLPQVAAPSAIQRALTRFYGTPNRGVREEDEFPDEDESSFKLLDAQNNTRSGALPPELIAELRKVPASTGPVGIAAPRVSPAVAPPAARNEPPRPAPPRPAAAGNTTQNAADPIAMLLKFEQSQQRSVAAVRAIVELLIEKGYFTRDEYLAKMRR